MDNIKEIRRKNLLLILEQYKANQLAEMADTTSTYISQVKNKTVSENGKVRGIGDSLARRIEKAVNKEHGWLDIPHGSTPSERQGISNKRLLIMVVSALDKKFKGSSAVKANFVISVYEELEGTPGITDEFVELFVDLQIKKGTPPSPVII